MTNTGVRNYKINFPLGFVLLMSITLAAYQFVTAVQTSQQSPQLTLQLIDGRKLALEDLSGHPVFITFWATSCHSCVKEIPLLSKLYKELSPRGFEIVAIAMPYDRPDFIVQMKNELDIPYPIALDLQGQAIKAFGNIRVTPNSFLIDENGNIIKHYVGLFDITELKSSIQTIMQNNKQRSLQ